MQNITPDQLKCLSTLVSKLGFTKDDKVVMVQGFSNGRATSSKDLLVDEATAMIKHLKSIDPQEHAAEKMRRKIISMAHEMGWKAPSNSPGGGGQLKADMKRIDDWCKKYSPHKKNLNNHTYRELAALVTQFTNGPYRHYMLNV
jgi:hypothetical protein